MRGVGGSGRAEEEEEEAEEAWKVPETEWPNRIWASESSESAGAEEEEGVTSTWKSAWMEPSWFWTRHE